MVVLGTETNRISGWLPQAVGEPILEPIQIISFSHTIRTLQRQGSDLFWSEIQPLAEFYEAWMVKNKKRPVPN